MAVAELHRAAGTDGIAARSHGARRHSPVGVLPRPARSRALFARPPDPNPMEPDRPGISPAPRFSLAQVPADFRERGPSGPRLRRDALLGHYAEPAMFLLNGSYRNAARGRGPRKRRNRRTLPQTRRARLVGISSGRTDFLSFRAQTGAHAVGGDGRRREPARRWLRAGPRPRCRLVVVPLPLHDASR